MRHPHSNRFSPAPLALAVALALSAPALTYAQAVADAKPVAISIAAQPLGDALNELGAAIGASSVAFSQALVAGKTAPAVKGSLTARQALDRLLAGSGLVGTINNGVLTVQRAPQAGSETTLATVTVTAAVDRSGSTEGTGSYTTNASRTATKLNLTPRETPQTLTVVTRQKMDDFGLTSLDNVLNSTSTISTLRMGNNGNTYFSRGFALQSQYDGLPNPIGIGQENRAASPDTAFLDKVEILQGASGLMAGAGEPGGTINLVRKRPTESFQASVETQLGSWNKKRLVGDVSGPLVASGKIRGRAVALVDHSDSFTDHVYENKQGFFGVIEADLTATTTLGASVMYQKNKFNEHYGVPMGPNGADLRLPRSSFYGVKDGDSTRESTTYSLTLDQKLAADWLLKTAYTRTNTEVDKVPNFLEGMLDASTGDGLSLWRSFQQRKFKSDVLDIYASGPFQLLGRQHELVFGATSAKIEDKNRLLTPYTQTPVNIYNFNVDSITLPTGSLPNYRTPNKTTQQGAYAAARLNLADSLKLIVGTRVSWYEYKAAGVSTQKESGVVTPYAGLIYDINGSTSLYASYSDIFKPQSSLKLGGGTIDPIVGKNYELGIKGELMQGRLNTSAAIFRLEQSNLSQVDQSVSSTACNGGHCYTAAGLVISQGVDLNISGEVTSGWQLGAGYTYVDSEYGNGSNKGLAYGTYIPQHILRAYTTYLIPGTGWTVGGDIRVQSRMYTEDTGFRIEQGGNAIVGLMAKYRINKQAEMSLVLNNLFDRRYYSSIGSYGTIQENFYGAPRSFAVNLKYAF